MLFLLSSAFSLENFIFLCYTVAIRQTEGGARREKARAQAFPVVLRENGQGRHRRLCRAGLVLDLSLIHICSSWVKPMDFTSDLPIRLRTLYTQ